MSATGEARHGLYQGLEEVIGTERASTLMEYLPPVGWADVATKHDLDVLKGDLSAFEERIDLRFEAADHKLRAEIAVLRGEMHGLAGGLQARLIRYYVGGILVVLFGVPAIARLFPVG